jgi:hypothetical protein
VFVSVESNPETSLQEKDLSPMLTCKFKMTACKQRDDIISTLGVHKPDIAGPLSTCYSWYQPT